MTGSLTVRDRSKLEKESTKLEEAAKAPSKWQTIFRWLVGILLFLSFTSCLVFSKISLIYISQGLYGDLSQNVTGVYDSPSMPYKATGRMATLAMIILVLMIPHGLTLLRVLFFGEFTSRRPWPSSKAIFVVSLNYLFKV